MRRISVCGWVCVTLLVVGVCGCGSDFMEIKCPPNGPATHVVYVPKDCSKGFEIYANGSTTKIGAQIEYLKAKVSPNVELAKTVEKLAENLQNITVGYRTAFVALCQSELADPCNQETQNKILEVRTTLAKRFDELSGKLAAAQQAAGKGATLGPEDQAVVKGVLDELVNETRKPS